MLKSAIAVVIAFLTIVSSAYAQTAQTAISPAKEKLIQRVLQLWHVEAVGGTMLQQPILEAARQARSLMQGRTTTDLQTAALKGINEDANEFYKASLPIVLDSAQKLIPSTVVPLLAEKFTEEELRQIIAILESPVKAKFEALVPEIKLALGAKITADSSATIEPKLTALNQRIGERMRAAIAP
ncbi:MAG: DUF2059 domain-containing protein [Burkholderiales bacterium]